VKVLAGRVKLKAVSSVALGRDRGGEVGASLVLFTVRTKLSLALAPLPSVAVTVIVALPTSALAGVPVKVRVAASKASQLGSVLVV
jgi:hypothetical protein